MSDKIYSNLLAQLERLARHNRQGSYRTRQRYYEAMQRFCRFLAAVFKLEKLTNVAAKHVHAYVAHMQEEGWAPATIKTDLAAIRFWHDKMSNPRHKKLPSNAELNLERRSYGKVDRTWPEAEFERMIELAQRTGRVDYAAVFTLACYAGLRIHECFRIDTAMARAALREGRLTIKGKNGKIRTVPIDGVVAEELAAMLKATSPGQKLFVADGEPTHKAIERLQRFIADHREEVKDEDSTRPLHAHGLRHTYAVDQYLQETASGSKPRQADLKVARLLGHNRPEVTHCYLARLERHRKKKPDAED